MMRSKSKYQNDSIQATDLIIDNDTGEIIEQDRRSAGQTINRQNIKIEAPRDPSRPLSSGVGYQYSHCTPYLGADPWAWRTDDINRRAAQHQREYAEECNAKWQAVDG